MQCINCNAQINVNHAACSCCNEPIVFGIDSLGKGFKKYPPGLWLPCSNIPKQTPSSMGSGESSREMATGAPSHNPNDAFKRSQLAWEYAKKGDAQRELGNYDQAIADCSQAIRLDSTIGYFWGIKGLCHQLKGNLDQAISDCTEAIRLEPQHPFNYETRAECYRLSGEFDLAMVDCTVIIRLDPMSAHAYRTRAGLHLKLQNLSATISDCDQAIRLDPSWTAYKAYTRRGIAYFYCGEIEKAVADCSEAMGPRSPMNNFALSTGGRQSR